MSTGTNRTESIMPQWRQFAPTAFLAVLGVVVSAVLFWAAYSWEMRSVRRDFDALADARCKEVSNAFKETATLLDFMDDVFVIAPRVDDPSFAGYLRYLTKLLEEDRNRHPEIISIIWAPRVSGGDRAAYEQAAQAAIDARFQIGKVNASVSTEADEGPSEQFPIYLRVAAKGDSGNLGEDMTIDPAAREIIRRSRDTGLPLAIAPIKIPNEAGDLGYRVFQPLYHADDSGKISDRDKSLVGFLCLDLDIDKLVAKAMMNIKPVGIDFQVCDVTEGKSAVLYRHSSRLSDPVTAGDAGLKELESNYTTEYFGRKVSIQCNSSQAFWAGRTIWQPWVVLLGGIAFTLVAAGYQINLAFRARAVDQAVTKRIARMQKEIEQRQQPDWQWKSKQSLTELTSGELRETAATADKNIDDGGQ